MLLIITFLFYLGIKNVIQMALSQKLTLSQFTVNLSIKIVFTNYTKYTRITWIYKLAYCNTDWTII